MQEHSRMTSPTQKPASANAPASNVRNKHGRDEREATGACVSHGRLGDPKGEDPSSEDVVPIPVRNAQNGPMVTPPTPSYRTVTHRLHPGVPRRIASAPTALPTDGHRGRVPKISPDAHGSRGCPPPLWGSGRMPESGSTSLRQGLTQLLRCRSDPSNGASVVLRSGPN